MDEGYRSPYKAARLCTSLNIPDAAERLYIARDTLASYELERRTVPNNVVARMCQLYGTPWLAFQHLSRTADGLNVVPDVTLCNIETASIRLYNRCIRFANAHRTERLLELAEDGVIDEAERPDFERIISDLDGIIAAAMEVKYARTKKAAQAVGTPVQQNG